MSRGAGAGRTCVTEDLLARLAAAPRLPAAFVRRVTELPPGVTLGYDPREWHDAIVVVREGVVELRLRSGVRRTFVARDLLWLAGLDVAELHNPGLETTALVSVRRRQDC
jgi:hypothetical protein